MASYLELDSTFRNRTRWPLPGEFDVLLSKSGTSTSNCIIQDPISICDPIIAWTGTLFNTNSLGTDFIRGTISIGGLGYGNSKNLFEIEVLPPVSLQQKYNYYINAVFRNLDKIDQVSRIIEYKYLGNNSAWITLSDNDFKFDLGDSFFIGDPTDLSDPNNGFLFVPTGSDNRQDYSNMIIYNESLKESRTISSYDGSNGILAIGGEDIFLWQNFHNFSIRQKQPNFIFFSEPGSTTSQIKITGIAATNSINYTNWFLRVQVLLYNNNIISPQNETRNITNYNLITNIATVFPPFSSNVSELNVELSQFGYDNSKGLNWGFKPLQQVPLYKVKLNRLILPNKVLKIGNGGKTAYQSHFYVELTNIDPSTVSNFLIFSNNPNSARCIFRCSVNQIANPESQEFVTLTGDNMTQTIRFRFDANMYFKVTLASTGEIFETENYDSIPPAKPKSNLQINALFEFIPV
jgi:hypothetical protein